MSALKPRHSKEEFARRGEEIYDRVVKPGLKPEELGKFVAIDIETEAFAIDANDFMATEKLLQKCPDAQMWLMRAGEKAACRMMGGRISLQI